MGFTGEAPEGEIRWGSGNRGEVGAVPNGQHLIREVAKMAMIRQSERSDPGRVKSRVNSALRVAVASIGMVGIGAVVLSSCGSSGSTSSASATSQTAAPAAKAQLFVDADTVSTAKTSTCWLQNRFQIGDKVLFRVKVFNGSSGAAMTKSDLQSVVIGLPNGQTLPATYGNHKTDNFWAVAWTVPANYPTGSINYTVTATSTSGATGDYVPFKVASSQLTILPTGTA